MQELFGNLGINWKLFLAQAINFLLIFWVLERFVFKKLFLHLADRRKKIERGIALTQKAEQEMLRIAEARKREIDSAKQQGDALLLEAKTLAQQKTQELLLLAKQEEEKVLLRAREQAQKQKNEAIQEAKDEIRGRALLFAEKILGKTLTSKDEERMAKEVFQELNAQSYAK